MTWWCRNLLFSLSCARISETLQTEMDVKTVNVIVKKQVDNNFPWFVLLSPIETTTRYSKLRIDLNIMTSFLRPVRVQTMENGCRLSQIKKGLNYIAARLFIVESFDWELRIRKMEKSVNNTHGYTSAWWHKLSSIKELTNVKGHL